MVVTPSDPDGSAYSWVHLTAMDRVRAGWLDVRSALRAGFWDALRFAFSSRAGLLFSLTTAGIAYIASRNLWASALGLLSFPVVVLIVFLWNVVKSLRGRSNVWSGAYEPQFGHGAKRLYLGGAFGDDADEFPQGLRCAVREPGGLTSVSDRAYRWNGWVFPAEFPEFIPPAPGRHHAVWFERGRSGRWWKLVEFDFDVPEGVAP